MSTPVLPDQRQWLNLTRDREFPLSGVLSVAIHAGVLLLLLFGVFRFLFDEPKSPSVEVTPVTLLEPEGAGNRGHGDELRKGIPTGTDDQSPVEKIALAPSKPIEPVEKVIESDVTPKLPDDPNGELVRPDKLPPLPKLGSLLKGLPSGNSSKGDGGKGDAVGGIGQSNKGPLDQKGGSSEKKRRMMRWTMLFSTQNANDYLRQMSNLDVILGVQMPDESIYIIRDLTKRPALAEKGARIEDRIFWMDDDPQSVRAMSAELQLDMRAWRIIAFFPEWVEKKLLERELAYGKRYGRTKEEHIQETKFRVDFRGKEAQFTVVEQR